MSASGVRTNPRYLRTTAASFTRRLQPFSPVASTFSRWGHLIQGSFWPDVLLLL